MAIFQRHILTVKTGLVMFIVGIALAVIGFFLMDLLPSWLEALSLIMGALGALLGFEVVVLSLLMRFVGENLKNDPLKAWFDKKTLAAKIVIIVAVIGLVFMWFSLLLLTSNAEARKKSVPGPSPEYQISHAIKESSGTGVATNYMSTFYAGEHYTAEKIAKMSGLEPGQVQFCCKRVGSECERYYFDSTRAFECSPSNLKVREDVTGRIRVWCPEGKPCLIGFYLYSY